MISSNQISDTTFSALIRLYQQIRNKVETELQHAQDGQKFLLLVAGEQHSDKNSFLLESILLLILHELNIKHLAVETSPNELNGEFGNLRLIKIFDYLSIFKWYKPYWLEDRHSPNLRYNILSANNELGMNLHAADSNNKLTIAFKERDATMVAACAEIKGHAGFLVGAAHLRGIFQATMLSSNYHICAMNLTSKITSRSLFDSYLNASIDFANSSNHLIRFEMPANVNAHRLTREDIQVLAKRLHDNYRNQKDTSFVAKMREYIGLKLFSLFVDDPRIEHPVTAEETSVQGRGYSN